MVEPSVNSANDGQLYRLLGDAIVDKKLQRAADIEKLIEDDRDKVLEYGGLESMVLKEYYSRRDLLEDEIELMNYYKRDPLRQLRCVHRIREQLCIDCPEVNSTYEKLRKDLRDTQWLFEQQPFRRLYEFDLLKGDGPRGAAIVWTVSVVIFSALAVFLDWWFKTGVGFMNLFLQVFLVTVVVALGHFAAYRKSLETRVVERSLWGVMIFLAIAAGIATFVTRGQITPALIGAAPAAVMGSFILLIGERAFRAGVRLRSAVSALVRLGFGSGKPGAGIYVILDFYDRSGGQLKVKVRGIVATNFELDVRTLTLSGEHRPVEKYREGDLVAIDSYGNVLARIAEPLVEALVKADKDLKARLEDREYIADLMECFEMAPKWLR